MDCLSESPHLKNWIPVRLYLRDAQPFVDWCYAGDERLTAPFFNQSVEGFLLSPANLLFRHQTPIDALFKLKEVRPSGFIFHMSRCGSTLITQMLSTLQRSIVISEAPPIDHVLRTESLGATEDQRIEWLRGMVNALGQPRMDERYLIVKLDAWHAVDMPLISRAFPGVPFVFVYRDPIDVLVSQFQQRGVRLIPGVIDPLVLGLDREAITRIAPEEYCARVLAMICEAGLRTRALGGKLVNYSELPDAVISSLLDFFNLECTEEEITAMRAASKKNAKNPFLEFEADSEKKQKESTPALREAAASWLYPIYQKLEAERLC